MITQTDGDITLIGVRGEVIPLSSPETPLEDGLGLREVPDGLSGTPRDHQFDEVTGEHRGVLPSSTQLRLDLQASGLYPREHVHDLLVALGSGGVPVTVVVTSPEMETRWKEYYYREVSNLQWHTTPHRSPLAQFSILLDAGRPEWVRDDQRVTLTESSTFGWVTLPVAGDLDVWPRFTITGTHGGVSLRLREEDDPQVVPYSAGGWVIDSRPDHRVVSDLAGAQDFQGFVPFWPEPAANDGGHARVEVLVTTPGPDFSMMIEYTPEATRGW